MEPAIEAQPKKSTGAIIVSVVLLLLLIGVSVFAVITTLDAQSKISEIDNLKKDVATKDETIKALGEAFDVKEGETVTPEVVKNDLTKSIVLGDLGIKIKVPDTLEYVSFQYIANDIYPELHVWGILKDQGLQALPTYADPYENEVGMGVITLYPEGQKNEECIASCDVFMLTYGGRDIYYSGPQSASSQDAASLEVELNSVQTIKEMLTEAEYYSKL